MINLLSASQSVATMKGRITAGNASEGGRCSPLCCRPPVAQVGRRDCQARGGDAANDIPLTAPCGILRRQGTLWVLQTQKVPMTAKIVSSDPEVLGGTPVFSGTRVPVAVLFENLADGMTLDEIIDAYPTLTRAAALAALREAEASLEREQAAA